MKSTSPFNWQAQPSTLFTKQEKATLHHNIVVRDLKPKVLSFYQKAKPKGNK
jgi:hypothetical protein